MGRGAAVGLYTDLAVNNDDAVKRQVGGARLDLTRHGRRLTDSLSQTCSQYDQLLALQHTQRPTYLATD